MNIHVPKNIQDKFKCLEFRGKPFIKKDGKKYIRAKHRTLYITLHYCFDDDFAWFYP